MFKIYFFENRAVYEVMWKNLVQPDKPKITILYGAEKMGFACRVTKIRTDTHIYYVQYLWLFHGNNGYRKRINGMLHVHCLFCL